MMRKIMFDNRGPYHLSVWGNDKFEIWKVEPKDHSLHDIVYNPWDFDFSFFPPAPQSIWYIYFLPCNVAHPLSRVRITAVSTDLAKLHASYMHIG